MKQCLCMLNAVYDVAAALYSVLETMLVHVECCVLMLQLHCTWACCLCLFFA